MRVSRNIGYDYFPQQNFLGRTVMVSFGYDTNRMIPGKVIRNDTEEPGVTIIQLDDGRIVLGTECYFEELDKEFKNQHVTYQARDIPISSDTRHMIIGAVCGRDLIDMDRFPLKVVKAGELITEEILRKLEAQGRTDVTIRETVIVPPSKRETIRS